MEDVWEVTSPLPKILASGLRGVVAHASLDKFFFRWGWDGSAVLCIGSIHSRVLLVVGVMAGNLLMETSSVVVVWLRARIGLSCWW